MIETKTFFAMLFTLLIIGTFCSLITGVPMPGSPTTVTTAVNNSLSLTNSTVTVCESWIPGYCAITGSFDLFKPIINAATNFVGFIWNGILLGISIFAYFSGIGTFLTGNSAFPEPFNLLFLMGLTFLWFFLILEIIARVVGVVWGR
jgi:hypothetical protein